MLKLEKHETKFKALEEKRSDALEMAKEKNEETEAKESCKVI